MLSHNLSTASSTKLYEQHGHMEKQEVEVEWKLEMETRPVIVLAKFACCWVFVPELSLHAVFDCLLRLAFCHLQAFTAPEHISILANTEGSEGWE